MELLSQRADILRDLLIELDTPGSHPGGSGHLLGDPATGSGGALAHLQALHGMPATQAASLLALALAPAGQQQLAQQLGSGAALGAPVPVPPLPPHLRRQQRILSAVPAVGIGIAGGMVPAAGVAGGMLPGAPVGLGAGLGGGYGRTEPSHDAATCIVPGCMRCAYEARLQRVVQQLPPAAR